MAVLNEYTDQFSLFEALGMRFGLPGKVVSCESIKNGNINQTVKVTFEEPSGSRTSYVFQRINTFVFKKPEEIMSNIDAVTAHIEKKSDPREVCLRFYHTLDGKAFVPDDAGEVWRVMNWINAMTYDVCEDLDVIRATGEAFGAFQMKLADFEGSTLYETIPDFHYTKGRLDTLFENVEQDPLGRVPACGKEIAYFAEIRELASEQSVRFKNGEYPVRVTHNDTKSNNVLFDKQTRRPLTVIDLDTVMPGFAPNDFGDAIRFISNTSAEDEPDLSKVWCDADKFRAFTEGFLSRVGDTLTGDEINNLVLASFSMTVECGCRFLADYLIGDPYFKILYPEHNLVRARCQIKLAQDILHKRIKLEKIVRECLNKQ